MLTRLAEIGMGIAEDAGRRSAALADGGAAGAGAPDPGLTYARAARAVRMSIALQSRLLNDLAGLDRAERAASAARVSARRNRAHRLVERAIEAACDDEDEIERLSSDAWERLIDEDDGDLTERPFGEIVARICGDLGLSPPPIALELAALDLAALDLAAPDFAASALGIPGGAAPSASGPAPARAAAVRPDARPRASPPVAAAAV